MKDWAVVFVLGVAGMLMIGWFIGQMMDIATCERRGGVSVKANGWSLSPVCVVAMEEEP